VWNFLKISWLCLLNVQKFCRKLYQEIHAAGSGKEIASFMPKILLFTNTAYIGIHFIFIHDFEVRA
jgi:hypothetical protein